MCEPYPVGVIEDPRSLHRPAQPVRVREVHRGHFHETSQWVAPCRWAAKGPYADALVNETSRHVAARVTEGPGEHGQAGVSHLVRLLHEGGSTAAQAFVGGSPDVCPPFGMW